MQDKESKRGGEEWARCRCSKKKKCLEKAYVLASDSECQE